MTNPLTEEYEAEKRWVNWKLETRDGKQTKVPYEPGGALASSTNPATWSVLADLGKNGYNGAGIVFTPDRLLLGIDGDHILTGDRITDNCFSQFVTACDTYTEVSQSDTGLHAFLALTEPLDLTAHKHKFDDGRAYECYTTGRYFTVTFKPFADKPIRRVTPDEALRLLGILGYPWNKKPPEAGASTQAAALTLDDETLLEQHVFTARNGAKAHALYNGDVSTYGNDDSAADIAFCNLLAWWTKDAAQIERIWSQSPLGKRDKTQNRKDYRDRTIKAALGHVTGGYTGGGGDRGADVDMNRAPGEPSEPAKLRTRPSIQTNGRPLDVLTADCIRALVAANNPPVLFVRSGAVVRVCIDETGIPTIQAATEDILRKHLADVADYVTSRMGAGGQWITTPVHPPVAAVTNILAAGAWDFPPLLTVIEAPAIRPDGTLLTEPGYDRATALYYIPAQGLTIPEIPENPTRGDMAAAVGLLDDLHRDYPFADDASKTNAYAATITAVIRPSIQGCIPLELITAPQPGTGKSLIAKTQMIVATGRRSEFNVMSKDPAELRKSITSNLMLGNPMVVYDNIDHKVSAGELSAALTAETWADRALGSNQIVRLPQRAIFVATGNNLQLGGDIPRRCYSIMLDAEMSKPWQREGFTHPDLLGYVESHRGDILAAVLTLARAWHAAGRPAAKTPKIGGFEAWVKTIGGILAHAGITGFLDNLAAMYDKSDTDGIEWETFLNTIKDKFGTQAFRVAELADYLATDNDAFATVPSSIDKLDITSAKDGAPAQLTPTAKKRLGWAFRARDGRRYGDGNIRIEQAHKDTDKKVAKWQIAEGADNSRGIRGIRGDFPTDPKTATTQTLSDSSQNNPVNPGNPVSSLWNGEI